MSAMELRNFEKQLEILSFSEQLAIMEYLARLIQKSHLAKESIQSDSSTKRQFGREKGKFLYPQDFDEDNEEIARMFGAV